MANKSALKAKDSEESLAALRAKEWLCFGDLKALGIVENWQTLIAWQDDPNVGFPRGRLFGPNSRRWSRTEIYSWVSTRPVERDDYDPPPRKRSRSRKARVKVSSNDQIEEVQVGK
jgi:hypothetical protein